MASTGTAPRPIRVYADGIYDMFHSGHARQLMQAKSSFPGVYLIVGVCNDDLTHERKGRVVMNETERYESIRHCRYVDELVDNAPWELDDEFLTNNKIDFVAHDDLPYGAEDQEDIYKWLKDRGMFVATQRTEGISTTDVIARIIRDYDMYVRRNLERGYTAKDLNVSYMREKRILFNEKVNKVKEKLADKRHQLLDKGQGMINRWEERSKDFIGGFLELFGRQGKFNQWWNEGRIRVARAISPTRELGEEATSTVHESYHGSSSYLEDSDSEVEGAMASQPPSGVQNSLPSE
ncbi:hypothetical protein CAPTEDRAFT_20528 [Capitella teleta]|uniref:choline-phosphate cytidylyltransferase n=1 Tax=Capitella teleta TaxID=283909 RepID=R7VF02_CAPTE|nr:hypothetical protein CAPTEDRAFT_20528 [Capitella teleta]|eukprot:ELU17438.1 hypothetical protein CAPTEDRAFT_20528 [Capitella teleta]